MVPRRGKSRFCAPQNSVNCSTGLIMYWQEHLPKLLCANVENIAYVFVPLVLQWDEIADVWQDTYNLLQTTAGEFNKHVAAPSRRQVLNVDRWRLPLVAR